MEEKRNVLDLASAPSDSERDDLEQQEGGLAEAFASLRAFADRDNPLSLAQTIARARQRADALRRWEQSHTPINDILARMSDGREIAVEKTIDTGACGFYFVGKFAAGAIMHIHRKADKRHPEEVLLHSVRMDAIPPEGYNYERVYSNGQTLRLNVQRLADGQFRVSVDYTPAAEETTQAAAGVAKGWVAGLGPALIALAQVFRKSNGGGWQPGRAFALSLLAVVALLAWLAAPQLQTAGHRGVRSGSGAPLATKGAAAPEAQLPVAGLARQGDLAGEGVEGVTCAVGVGDGGGGGDAATDANTDANYTAVVTDADTDALRKDIKDLRRVLESLSTQGAGGGGAAAQTVGTPAAAQAAGVEGAGRQRATPAATRNEKASFQRGGVLTPAAGTDAGGRAAAAEPHQIAIYVKAFAKDDEALTEAMQHAFVSALRDTKRFIVLTDNAANIPTDAYWVDLWFMPKAGCQGTIAAELYAAKDNVIWADMRDCYEYPKGALLEKASQQMVAQMVSELNRTQGEGLE